MKKLNHGLCSSLFSENSNHMKVFEAIRYAFFQTTSTLVQEAYPKLNEPRHDKTNKMSVCPAKTQISLGIHPV